MSVDDGYNVAARYRTVRKHLDSLGYKQALSLDALPLIEKLLADLIQTTESLKHFKTIAQDNLEACSQLQLAVEPYKYDNARLVQECNQLHADLIQLNDTYSKHARDLKRQIYKLECECNDLQLVSSRNLQRIKELELESCKKSKKILELQGKCLKPTISNVSLASKQRPCYPLRRPVLESEPMPKTGTKVPLPGLSSAEPKVLDLLNMADHKMSCLSHEISKLKEELTVQTENVHVLKNQLSTKEKEVDRLKRMLEGGRPYSAIVKDCTCKTAGQSFKDSYSAGENCQLHILQQDKLDLEQQLKEALNKQHDAMSQALKLAERNEELEKELRDIDHIALAVEADCNTTVKENNKRVCKLQEKLDSVMIQTRVLENELAVERKEVQELRADLEACKLEKRNMQRTLESGSDEKKQLTDKINELTVIEKTLNSEIERLIRVNENQKQDILELQCTNKILKEQLRIKDNIRVSDEEKGQKEDHNKASKSQKDPGRLFDSDNGDAIREAQIVTLQETIVQLRKERDYYRDEYNSIKSNYARITDENNSDLWARMRELKRQLTEKENTIDDLQRDKRELARDKGHLETQLEICRCDRRGTCRPCGVCKHTGSCTCSTSPGTTGITRAMLDRLEHERDVARTDVNRLMEERDALRERLQMAAETHTTEQRRMRDNLLDLESRLKHIEQEKDDLVLTQGTRRATINGLEDELDHLRDELRRAKQEVATLRTQNFQLRALQDQTDQALGDVQSQLTQSETELTKATDRNRAMERQQIQLDSQVKELKHEINTLRTNMTHIDHEKDQLLMILDEKTERIAALEREIISKEQQAIGMEQRIRELQHKNELAMKQRRRERAEKFWRHESEVKVIPGAKRSASARRRICIDQSAEQERQLRSMQVQMENLERQLETTSADRENAIQENRRLQDDLAAVTCEVRRLQHELETSRAESYDLKRQLQTYVSEVRRAEDLLDKKENERTEMLNHFRSLSLEATVLENNNHSLESEAAEARGALQNARDRLLDLERQLVDRDCLIRGYETQISELTQTVATMETQLRQQSEQKYCVEADLTAVRDLCVKLDQQKDALMQQLNDRESIKMQYDTQIGKLNAEQNIIKDQMSRDRATVERLENLLDQARQESITAQSSNQELQSEISRLKQKISELNSKLATETAELRQYQNLAADYSKQIMELRRQVTNERFDRARREEENRRYFQQENLEEHSLRDEQRRKAASQRIASDKTKENPCNSHQDKRSSYNAEKEQGNQSQYKQELNCNCLVKVHKEENVNDCYSNISTLEKPKFASTHINENSTVLKKDKIGDIINDTETIIVTQDSCNKTTSSVQYSTGLHEADASNKSVHFTAPKNAKEVVNSQTKSCGVMGENRQIQMINIKKCPKCLSCKDYVGQKLKNYSKEVNKHNLLEAHDSSLKSRLQSQSTNNNLATAIYDITVKNILSKQLPSSNSPACNDKKQFIVNEENLPTKSINNNYSRNQKESNVKNDSKINRLKCETRTNKCSTSDSAKSLSQCTTENNAEFTNNKCNTNEVKKQVSRMEDEGNRNEKICCSGKTRDQTTITDIGFRIIHPNLTESELIKILTEFKGNPSNLKEQLVIMNKSISTSDTANDKSNDIPSIDVQKDQTYCCNRKKNEKDANTQEPDKRNAYA